MHRVALRAAPLAVLAACAALALAAPLATAGRGGAQAAAAPTCKARNLVVWLPNASGNGAAGSVFYKLRITNLGSASCSLSGFPKVTAINLKGATVGKPASQEGGEAGVVTLKSGGSASFQLRVVAAGNFSPSDCHATMAAGLRVTPPGAGGSKVVPFPFETCAKPVQPVLGVRPVKKS